MNKLEPQDLLSAADYEKNRSDIRQRIITLKKRRRIGVGDLVTLVFENRETVLWQIQEMIRTERIFDPLKIQEELDVYNDLLPNPGELQATLFIEITDMEKIQELLDSFQGIDGTNTLALKVGDHSIYGSFEGGHSKEDKISAVHFVRFSTTTQFRAHLAQLDIPAFVSIFHSNYRAETPVSPEMRREWLNDLES
ncbi:MAG: DUF3501 family protein [Nitrospirales bacterium]